MPISIGVSFPESIVPGTPLPDIAGLAALAEQAGLDGVWVGDRADVRLLLT
jgi:alkanesulfonate monooxygenase SsuD/methylene tetrahydromethanopterin reductase-like flavin-dependent oxidoreductase (luciferase family)